MGATDERNMTKFVIEALISLENKFTVNIILGPGYCFLKELEIVLEDCGFKYFIFIDPQDIVKVMSKADIAIVSFGVTSYELVALKIPALYLCLTKDHKISSSLFEDNNLGKTIGLFSDASRKKINREVSSLLSNPEEVLKMHRSQSKIDISNMKKISNIIFSN